MTNVVTLPISAPCFDDFWRIYPKKVGKPLAKAKWDAITGEGLETRTLDRDSGQYVNIVLKATPEEVIAGARRYEAANRKPGTGNYGYRDDGKYLAHPGTWLNQGRWDDQF